MELESLNSQNSQYLDLRNQGLVKIPDDVGSLAIEVLDIRNNPRLNSVPPWFWEWRVGKEILTDLQLDFMEATGMGTDCATQV